MSKGKLAVAVVNSLVPKLDPDTGEIPGASSCRAILSSAIRAHNVAYHMCTRPKRPPGCALPERADAIRDSHVRSRDGNLVVPTIRMLLHCDCFSGQSYDFNVSVLCR